MRTLVLFLILSGCAALKGQWDYDGAPGDAPKMSFVRRLRPAPHQPFSAMYLGQESDSVVEVTNPTQKPMLVTVDCDNLYTMYADVLIPPMSGQSFLLHGDEHKCWIRNWSFQ